MRINEVKVKPSAPKSKKKTENGEKQQVKIIVVDVVTPKK